MKSPSFGISSDVLLLSHSTSQNFDDINGKALGKFPGIETVYPSADSAVTEGGADGNDIHHPLEYLNSINASGLPLAKLKLKIGAPIMILRNIDPRNGICNGTRAVLTQASRRVLEFRVLGGEHAGRMAFVPRISLSPANSDLPFQFKRRQFPVRLAFSMTINKSQGQSVKNIGLDLQTPVFTHGQLYVALSWCRSSHCIKAIFHEDSIHSVTTNIVYPGVLLS